jgi:transposase-like protein
MWFQDTEGAKSSMQVLTDLKTRGVRDIRICCVDGLKKGSPKRSRRLPQTTVQTGVVHLIRQSLGYVQPRRYHGSPAGLTGLPGVMKVGASGFRSDGVC